MALICCENLTLAYEGAVVVEDLEFEVNAGDYLCVVGENGSGKSTLLKAILALKSPLGGKIALANGLRRPEIGYLPQQTAAHKDFPASVWEVVLSGCLNRRGIKPFYSPAERKLALLNMEKLGISGLKRRSFRELSGGQQKKVLLARALCAAGRLVLLDEPTAGLDPSASAELYRLIKSLNDGGMTVIMVSHDIEAAVKYASHILHLQNRPLFFGRTGDYLKSEAGRRFSGGMGDV